MSENKQIFTDPGTGEEMGSTWLARGMAKLAGGAIFGLFFGLLFGLMVGFLFQFEEMSDECFNWIIGGLIGGLVFGVVYGMSYGQDDPLIRQIHNGLARQQHGLRQLLVRPQEFPGVPDGALSRAQPTGEPQPTDTSLSQVEQPEEEPRLAGGVEVETEAEEAVVVAEGML